MRAQGAAVSDPNGHGTFVASLAAGSSSNGDGIAGSSGDARLMVDRGGRPARLVHGRRRGRRDRLRRRSRRTDHQPQPGRSHDLLDGAPRGRLRRRQGRAAGRGDRQQPRRREPRRVSGRAPAARRLARRRRTRALGRGVDEVRRTRVVLQHGHAHLPRSARRSRLRRRLRRILRIALPARQPSGLGRRALRLRQRHVVRHSAGGRCCGARLGGKPTAPRQGGRSDSQAHSLRRRKVEPAARLRRPRRRCSRGAGAGYPRR